MAWLSENWVFLLVVVAMVAMHFFGHGGHGGHGRSEGEERNAGKDRGQDVPRGGHRH